VARNLTETEEQVKEGEDPILASAHNPLRVSLYHPLGNLPHLDPTGKESVGSLK
jgi:hypothetical protein